MQEGQFKRAFCIMKVIDFYPFQKFLAACDGNTKDAVLLVYLFEQYYPYGEKDLLISISNLDIKENTGLTLNEQIDSLIRVKEKFGIYTTIIKCSDGDELNFYHLNISRILGIIQYPF
jgi:hypothetical protein